MHFRVILAVMVMTVSLSANAGEDSYPHGYGNLIKPGVYGYYEQGMVTVWPVLVSSTFKNGNYFQKNIQRLEYLKWSAKQPIRLDWDLDANTLFIENLGSAGVPFQKSTHGDEGVWNIQQAKEIFPTASSQTAWDADVTISSNVKTGALNYFDIQMAYYDGSGPIFDNEPTWALKGKFNNHCGTKSAPLFLLFREGFYKIDIKEPRSAQGIALFGVEAYLNVQMGIHNREGDPQTGGILQVFRKEDDTLTLISQGPFTIRDGVVTGYTLNESKGDLMIDLKEYMQAISQIVDPAEIPSFLKGEMKLLGEEGAALDPVDLTPIDYSPFDRAPPPTEK